jgi:small subunit ribosomal protein S6
MKYEFTLLIEEEKDLENLKKLFVSQKVKILSEEKWGKRTLAYPVKKCMSAFYITFSIDIDQKIVAELKRKFDFEEKILRYLLIKKEN